MHAHCKLLVVRPAPEAFDPLVREVIESVAGKPDGQPLPITFSTPCYGGGFENIDDATAIQHMINGHRPDHVLLIAFCDETTAAREDQLKLNRETLRKYQPAVNADGYEFEVHAFIISLQGDDLVWRRVEEVENVAV